MKKNYLMLLLSGLALSAQVPNSSFEEVYGYGQEVAHWGQFYVVPVSMDPETGETVSDEITFGESTIAGFCTGTDNAHFGSHALFVRNAFNVTQNAVIPGKADLFNTDISDLPTGWNTGIPVAPGTEIAFFGFWYKFAPAGNDVAQATLELFDADGQSVGKSTIPIAETQTEFTYVYAPLDITANNPPAFMTIEFSMAQEGSVPTFGSTLTVDDVVVNTAMLADAQQHRQALVIYPTVTDDVLNISGDKTGNANAEVFDMTGKAVGSHVISMDGSASVNVSGLAKGMYVIRLSGNGFSQTQKFLKE